MILYQHPQYEILSLNIRAESSAEEQNDHDVLTMAIKQNLQSIQTLAYRNLKFFVKLRQIFLILRKSVLQMSAYVCRREYFENMCNCHIHDWYE